MATPATLRHISTAIGATLAATIIALLLALGFTYEPAATDIYAPADGGQADTWHGNINTVGGGQGGGSNANPNDNTNGIHGIANNPGQSGNSPADQGNPSCNMHGGFNGAKSQCP